MTQGARGSVLLERAQSDEGTAVTPAIPLEEELARLREHLEEEARRHQGLGSACTAKNGVEIR